MPAFSVAVSKCGQLVVLVDVPNHARQRLTSNKRLDVHEDLAAIAPICIACALELFCKLLQGVSVDKAARTEDALNVQMTCLWTNFR